MRQQRRLPTKQVPILLATLPVNIVNLRDCRLQNPLSGVLRQVYEPVVECGVEHFTGFGYLTAHFALIQPLLRICIIRLRFPIDTRNSILIVRLVKLVIRD